MRHAFSLVELSIVLVILGLLVGGVLAGQSLIYAAGLRSVTTQESRYVAATLAFRDKYFALPGDMNNATQFWGRENTNADCVTNSGAAVNASTGVCDGNGNGALDGSATAGQSYEYNQYWRQMALAGLIEGSYSGLWGAIYPTDTTNVPQGKFNNGLWQVSYQTTPSTGSPSTFDNTNMFGGQFQYGAIGSSANSGNRNPVFKPEDAWNIDTKIDDGKPATGKFRVRVNTDYQALSACTTAASTSDTTAQYQLTSTAIGCAGVWYAQF